MVTDCAGLGFWDMSDAETVFLHGTLSLMRIIIPAAICLLIWRVRITNRPGNVLVLGLDESTNSQMISSRVSRPLLFLYATTAFITFELGLLTFRAYEVLQQMLIKLTK